MPITRDDQTNILRHLLYNVLNIGRNNVDHAILVCFEENKIKTIADFEGLEVANVDQLTYTKFNATRKVPQLHSPAPHHPTAFFFIYSSTSDIFIQSLHEALRFLIGGFAGPPRALCRFVTRHRFSRCKA